jgi:ABC-type glycerol-3-phosphate transport system permease component
LRPEREDAETRRTAEIAPQTLPYGAAIQQLWGESTKGYRYAWGVLRPYMLNSLFVSICTMLGVVLVGSVTAYVLARYRFPGHRALFLAIISFMMIPGILTLVPSFLWMKKLGLLNSYWVLILPMTAGGQVMAIFLFKSFFEGLPQELFESARLDGASHFRQYWHIVLPLSKQVMAVVIIVNLLGTWNSFLWPFIVNNNAQYYTVAQGTVRDESAASGDGEPVNHVRGVRAGEFASFGAVRLCDQAVHGGGDERGVQGVAPSQNRRLSVLIVPIGSPRRLTPVTKIARAALSALFLTTPIAFAATPTTSKTQQACLPEKDPSSPRHSQLKSTQPSDEIVRIDVDKDGDPDIIERWLNGKRVRWIDENDDMRPSDAQGDQVLDAMQVDRDGDGYYDGPEDINIKWVDDNGDGRPDVQIFAANPRLEQRGVSSGTSVFMAFIDVDQDGVNGFIDWNTYEFNQANWRVPPTTSPTHLIPPPNFSPDYMGNTIFLKQHLPPWVISDCRLNWENPFAFYDFDGDGCTEMSIRLLDDAPRPASDPSKSPKYTYTGFAFESYTGWDLDNDSTKGNEFDFDMTWRFASDPSGKKGGRIDYRKYSDPHPKMKAPQWVLDGKYFRFDSWRKIEDFCYVTHDKCFEETWKTDWAECWIVFDEDDDDHRWERVELYYPPADVYSTHRWEGRKRGTGGLPGHAQSDTLGDRGEWDEDNSGKGKVYVGAWDGKIHLFGAEKGAWIVDEKAKYWGSSPVLGNSSPERAPKVEELCNTSTPTRTGSSTRSPTTTTKIAKTIW